jgi:hypothetical protein
MVHGNLLNTGRVLVWAGFAEGMQLPFADNAAIWDPATRTTTTVDVPDDIFCTHQTFLPDGRLFLTGGDGAGTGHVNNHSYIFTPGATPDTGSFAFSADMAFARWYPTSVSLGDGRVIAVSGDSSAEPFNINEVEVFDGTSWSIVAGATKNFFGLYPGLHLLPSGEIFYTGTGWNNQGTLTTAYLTLTGPTSGFWTEYGTQEFYDRQEGMSVQFTDTTVDPVRSSLYVFGGGQDPGGAGNNNATAEVIDFDGGIAGSSWRRIADMNFGRSNINAVILPTGKVLIVGGETVGRFSPENRVPETETYDPATDTWTVGASVAFHHGYHASVVLLPDGRVLAAGGAAFVDKSMELYSPSYLNEGPRPVIGDAPASVGYGDDFSIETSNGNLIETVALIAPIATTHQTAPGQRYIKLPIKKQSKHGICTTAPATGNIAPPGDYMLFVVDKDGLPSNGRFVRIAP